MKYSVTDIIVTVSIYIGSLYVTTFQISWLVSIFGLQIVKNYRLATHSPQWMGIEPARRGVAWIATE